MNETIEQLQAEVQNLRENQGSSGHTPTLAKKLAKAMAAIESVPKNGYNSYDRYNYATHDDVMNVVRVALAEQGVALFSSMESIERDEAGKTKQGAIQVRTTVQIRFTLVEGETGEVQDSVWFGEAIDRGDKGIAKAATNATKYWLVKTFLIPSGELDADTDHDSPNAEPERQAKKQSSSPAAEHKRRARKAVEGYSRREGNGTDEVRQAALHMLKQAAASGDRAKYDQALKSIQNAGFRSQDDPELKKAVLSTKEAIAAAQQKEASA